MYKLWSLSQQFNIIIQYWNVLFRSRLYRCIGFGAYRSSSLVKYSTDTFYSEAIDPRELNEAKINKILMMRPKVLFHVSTLLILLHNFDFVNPLETKLGFCARLNWLASRGQKCVFLHLICFRFFCFSLKKGRWYVRSMLSCY